MISRNVWTIFRTSSRSALSSTSICRANAWLKRSREGISYLFWLFFRFLFLLFRSMNVLLLLSARPIVQSNEGSQTSIVEQMNLIRFAHSGEHHDLNISSFLSISIEQEIALTFVRISPRISSTVLRESFISPLNISWKISTQQNA